ncbi:hypothetical protein PhaeoP30_03931 (plasmid) [Phaeobacter inhibens]|uniref:Uncharacterized protein n=1 Tax=Phaeobacter gallaeciensis TaxID=60890 RepID=A0AAC9ZE28_9RHOB|nr:hypothetical protein Gal_04037 [Phaeobacter gallaeciensis DSM 26640]ATE95009.1 hypothetical protein PhaeoP11_04023 [Phaeobacter gallaeciensis]AUQ60790.1 hypothetical protein PhaeoP30_03931 [Phaeobacter inhibens]ATE99275.1 hypothetical protein PhaeoP73_04014 [Phaeobacter gallaeciensis]ATF03669.1 hypothetical protein PhaeoP75_04068 [Phaeobacter gallaeciensis]
MLGVSRDDLSGLIDREDRISVACASAVRLARLCTGQKNAALRQTFGNSTQHFRILIKITGKCTFRPEKDVEAARLRRQVQIAGYVPFAEGGVPFLRLRNVYLNDPDGCVCWRCGGHKANRADGSGTRHDRHENKCGERIVPTVPHEERYGQDRQQNCEEAKSVAANPCRRLARNIVVGPCIGDQVPGKACQHGAAQPFRNRPADREDQCAGDTFRPAPCERCHCRRREQRKAGGQSSHRRNGHPGEPLRVDEKALRDPGQSEQEVANAERPSGKSGPHAALSEREEIQRAKRDGQKHRHREWWQSENRQSAEAECTECEDDT